jgi:hypothetical protein
MNRRWSRIAMYSGLILILVIVAVVYLTGHH